MISLGSLVRISDIMTDSCHCVSNIVLCKKHNKNKMMLYIGNYPESDGHLESLIKELVKLTDFVCVYVDGQFKLIDKKCLEVV